jgi:hypothetical protein
MQNLGDCIWRTTRGICTLYQCWHEIFTRERREGSKRQEKRKKGKTKKRHFGPLPFGERERECTTYSERINSMKSDSWSEHSQDLLALSGSDQTLSDVSSLAHIFFLWRLRRKSLAYAHCARRSLQNENPTSPSSDERPPPLLRRLLRPARSFAPSSPGPSSSHPFLLLPTRLFFLKLF